MPAGKQLSFSLKATSENTVCVQFHLAQKQLPSPQFAATIACCVDAIRQDCSPYIIDIVPAYTSILIYYDFLSVEVERLLEALERQIKKATENSHNAEAMGKTIEVPTYYSESSGPDLVRLANTKQCSTEDIIRLHSERDYSVFALGFAPGFPYLGFVDEALVTPRLSTPRTHVAKGSVGIADAQTGIYPEASPGGWNIIGQTPFSILHYQEGIKPSSPFAVGDTVRFVPIGKAEFDKLSGRPL